MSYPKILDSIKLEILIITKISDIIKNGLITEEILKSMKDGDLVDIYYENDDRWETVKLAKYVINDSKQSYSIPGYQSYGNINKFDFEHQTIVKHGTIISKISKDDPSIRSNMFTKDDPKLKIGDIVDVYHLYRWLVGVIEDVTNYPFVNVRLICHPEGTHEKIVKYVGLYAIIKHID